MDEDISLGVKVRCLQQKCKLSTLQAECVANLLAEECGGKKANLRKADRVMNDESRVTKVILHGCVGQACVGHVYGPQDKRDRCPECNHPRYKANSTAANEIVYHFPIRERLQALLHLPNFVKLLQVNIVCYNIVCLLRVLTQYYLFCCFCSTKKQGKRIRASFPTFMTHKLGNSG